MIDVECYAFLPNEIEFGIKIYKLSKISFVNSFLLEFDQCCILKHYKPEINIKRLENIFNKNCCGLI